MNWKKRTFESSFKKLERQSSVPCCSGATAIWYIVSIVSSLCHVVQVLLQFGTCKYCQSSVPRCSGATAIWYIISIVSPQCHVVQVLLQFGTL